MLTASELWLDRHIFNESELALFPECMLQCARKALDTAGIVERRFYANDTVRHQNYSFSNSASLTQVAFTYTSPSSAKLRLPVLV
jgi:hypothetical protein